MDIDRNKRSVGSDGGYYDASDYTDADGDEKYDYGEDDGDEEEEDDDDDDVPFKLPDIPGNFIGVIFKQPDGQSTLEVRPNTDKSGSGLDLDDADDSDDHYYGRDGRLIKTRRPKRRGETVKSENFEVLTDFTKFNFTNVGGYANIKAELMQCSDILTNYKKYAKYNVRTPKGVILEGPPGNGKTLLAKCFAGETNTSFIPVSGSQFQEKYVGVGASRVRELFELANKNSPCIIFIDEIDAIGRARSSDGEESSSERDSTLNELLVGLDGFNTGDGIFLIGATNRADLLDPALVRPGRVDKRIFIGNPDSSTREEILNIHLKGKPFESAIEIKDLVDITASFSCAQIENILNEAMLFAIRDDRERMTYKDIDEIINKMLVGWQPSDHQFSQDIIDRIAIHEMGHAIVGFLSKYHSKVSKVIINLSSPNSPGYTMFESSTSNIYTREALFEHLMILMAGRIAEEAFYDVSTTTGAINDFEETLKLAEKMIVYYGMGRNAIYPKMSDKYKEMVDLEVATLIEDAYKMSSLIVKNTKDLIFESANILKKEKIIKIDTLTKLINEKYPDVLKLKVDI
jgi:cell division protease FtsH